MASGKEEKFFNGNAEIFQFFTLVLPVSETQPFSEFEYLRGKNKIEHLQTSIVRLTAAAPRTSQRLFCFFTADHG